MWKRFRTESIECSRIPSGVPGIRMMKRICVPGDRRSTFTKHGVLEVEIPKPEEEQPKQITVEVEQG